MAEYIPSPRDWVREQVELYESSGGTQGTTLRDTGLPCIIFTHQGNKSGAIRKTPLMRVKDADSYVLVGSMGGAPTDPVWVHNLRADPAIELRDETNVWSMRARRGRRRRGTSTALGIVGGSVPALRGIPGQDDPPYPGVHRGADAVTRLLRRM